MGHAPLTVDEVKIKRWARRLTSDPNFADDAESIAHFTILQCRETWDPERTPSYLSYISAKVRFAVIDEIRRITHCGRSADRVVYVDPDEMRTATWGFEIDDPLFRASMERALRDLTDQERTVVYGLAEGKSKQEIADGMGVHPSRVSQHLTRIRTVLAQQFEVVA